MGQIGKTQQNKMRKQEVLEIPTLILRKMSVLPSLKRKFPQYTRVFRSSYYNKYVLNFGPN